MEEGDAQRNLKAACRRKLTLHDIMLCLILSSNKGTPHLMRKVAEIGDNLDFGMTLTSRSHRARSTLSSKPGSTTVFESLCVLEVVSARCVAARLLRQRAVAGEDDFPTKSTSVLDLGGEEDDLEDREGLEGMATFGELLVEAEAEDCAG